MADKWVDERVAQKVETMAVQRAVQKEYLLVGMKVEKLAEWWVE